VQVVFRKGSSQDKAALLQQVAAVKPGGCTNLCAGLEAGFKEINIDETTRQKRIFLFSDGLVNSGCQDKQLIQNKCSEFHAAGVNTSTFGLGSGFDETLMRNLAEYGRGDFFFINSNQEIERIIGRAISGLLWTVGTDANLKVRGKNGAVLKKIYHHPDLIKGASLGDLKENDIKQIVAEFEMGPSGSGEVTLEFLEYSLEFDSKKTHSKTCKPGSLTICTTDVAEKLVVPDKVIVALKVAQTAEHDKKILELIEKDKIDKAIALQQEHVAELKVLEKTVKDENGFFKVTIMAAERSLLELSTNKGNKEEVKKHVGYSAYLNENQCNFEGFTYCNF